MTEQIEALRLAQALEHDPLKWCDEAAAELRRLSAENEAFGIHLSERMKDLAKVEAQRDALLAENEALRKDAERYRFIRDADRSDCITPELALYAMETLDEYVDAAMDGEAAIKAVEENT